MTRDNAELNRRTALRTITGTAFASIAGCLDNGGNVETATGGGNVPADQNALKRVAVDGTALVVELTGEATVDQINLIQPHGELFGTREVATGSRKVTFEIGTSYTPGEYRVLALQGEETVVETSLSIQPELEIQDVGLYRNNPDKPWDEVYGNTQTDRKKNGEAFVTVENRGNGPDAAVELRFSGDVPNPIENPRGSGIYETKQVEVSSGETTDLFSNSFPFGSKSEDGMGCSPEGNNGQFTVIVETQASGNQVTNRYDVQYSNSENMTNCDVTITED